MVYLNETYIKCIKIVDNCIHDMMIKMNRSCNKLFVLYIYVKVKP